MGIRPRVSAIRPAKGRKMGRECRKVRPRRARRDKPGPPGGERAGKRFLPSASESARIKGKVRKKIVRAPGRKGSEQVIPAPEREKIPYRVPGGDSSRGRFGFHRLSRERGARRLPARRGPKSNRFLTGGVSRDRPKRQWRPERDTVPRCRVVSGSCRDMLNSHRETR